MAQKRMFSKQITHTDAFVDMPLSARLLYYELNMEADDDGVVASPSRIMRMIGCSKDDLNVLIGRSFVIPFENSGVVIIKHWLIHNTIRKDRYIPTTFTDEISSLQIKENKAYTTENKDGLPNGNQMATVGMHSIVESSIVESSIVENNTIVVENDSVSDIIRYLNNSIGSNYKTSTRKTRDSIKARLNEGFVYEDFVTVIEKKKKEWQGTDMERFLRPETLFGTKFEGYLNQQIIEKDYNIGDLEW